MKFLSNALDHRACLKGMVRIMVLLPIIDAENRILILDSTYKCQWSVINIGQANRVMLVLEEYANDNYHVRHGCRETHLIAKNHTILWQIKWGVENVGQGHTTIVHA